MELCESTNHAAMRVVAMAGHCLASRIASICIFSDHGHLWAHAQFLVLEYDRLVPTSYIGIIGDVGAIVGEPLLGNMMTTNDSASTSDKSRLLARYAWLLDSSIRLPFGRRIGLDGIIGLIPGIGDGIGAILSSVLIFSAWRMGVPPAILLRMASNIAIDTAVGTIPLVGDLFDLAFKANQRNVQLLQRFEQDSSSVQRQSFRVLAVTGLVTILLLTALITGVTFAGIALTQLLAGR